MLELHAGTPVHQPVVATRQGKVRGFVVEGVYAFKGIPYAAAPFGPHHLRPPQPVTPWSGVRDALAFGPEPPQALLDAAPPSMKSMPTMPVGRAASGDECLNLNVWTPALGAARLPVMVWITGGAFEISPATWYDGRRFARDGVVCVSINYRPGAEGFLHLLDAVPNRGLLDQIAALEWVRDNIAAFGGDPHNVTACGESAGAMSIGVLLSMPGAEGLFRRAILQSGAAHHVVSAAVARRIGRSFADHAGVAPCLREMATVSVERMLAAQTALKADLMTHPDPERWGKDVVASTMPFQPVVDGEVVPHLPIQRIGMGASAGVDVLIGTNVDEWRMMLVASGAFDEITEQVLTGTVNEHGSRSIEAYGLPLERALSAYGAANPGARPGDLLSAVQTDWWCRIPAIRLAEAHVGGGGRTFMYEFAWRSPAADGMFGACHALEIPFVFDTLDEGANQMLGNLLGEHPPQELADAMHAAWIAFMRGGDPGWDDYELGRRATMRFDAASRVVDDPRAAERALWDGVR